jgi:uncharacterized damage-inducible protein DinB
MSLQKLMTNYAEFNLWANRTMVQWLQTKPEELLDKKVPSSYPSIIGTIVHIWNTEVFWLQVLQVATPPPVFTDGFEGSNEDAMKAFINQSEQFADYIGSLSESDLLEICTLDASWMSGQLPKYEFIQHCLNHSTYHRGQIITIGRNIGITDPPMTDYNYYNMAIKGK